MANYTITLGNKICRCNLLHKGVPDARPVKHRPICNFTWNVHETLRLAGATDCNCSFNSVWIKPDSHTLETNCRRNADGAQRYCRLRKEWLRLDQKGTLAQPVHWGSETRPIEEIDGD